MDHKTAPLKKPKHPSNNTTVALPTPNATPILNGYREYKNADSQQQRAYNDRRNRYNKYMTTYPN